MGFSFGLVAVSVAVSAAVLFVALPRLGKPGAPTLFLRLTVVSGLAAVASSVMYLIFIAGGGIVPRVVGDTAMVLAPAVFFIALRVLSGDHARRWSVAVVAVGLGVAIVSASAPLSTSGVVKVAVLAVVCAACGVAAARSDVEPRAPMRLLIVTCGGYAVFCVVRLLVGLLLGLESAVYTAVFSFTPVTAAGCLAVLMIGIAVVRLFAARSAVPERPAGRPAGAIVVLGDWDLASAAYGTDRMRGLVSDLREAGRTLDPDATDVPRGIEVGVAQPLTALAHCLRSQFGWSADEITLLADGASTGAIRTPVRRRIGWSRSRIPRT